MSKKELKTASVLAFERKLDPSDALFHAGRWDDRHNADSWGAIRVREKSVRGTISNRLKGNAKDPAKLDAEIQNPNLQTVDVATLPPDLDTLMVKFTLRVLGRVGAPSTCNNSDYEEKLRSSVQRYADNPGFGEVAKRFACNLANGRFLWRNRIGSEQIEVCIRHFRQGKEVSGWTFDANKFSLRDFQIPNEESSSLNEMAEIICQGLSDKGLVLLEVTAFARMGAGQEVYPSQELILDHGSNKGQKKGQKSKTLYSVSDIAAMHSQKIGNALRTIDTWYPNAQEEELGPIAVEPYGSVTSQGKAYRQPKQRMDFYSLFDQWVLKEIAPDSDQQHYVMANLVRGGVFGEKG